MAVRQFHASGGAIWDMPGERDVCSCDHVEGRPSQAYNEEAFRYFLDVERRRAEVSNRPFLLVLIDLKKSRGASSRMSQQAALRLFSRLSFCLRETDFVGWYRGDRVAGAVLTQRPGTPQTDVSQQVVERVRQALAMELESDVSRRLQVRVFRIPPVSAREHATLQGES